MPEAEKDRPAVASAPVRGVGPAGTPLWYVSRDADIRKVLTCPHASSDPSRPGFPDPEDLGGRAPFLIELDAPRHAHLRRLVLPEFTSRSIKGLHARLELSATQLIVRMCAVGPDTDLAEAFAKPMASQAICHLLAVPVSDGPKLTMLATTLADDSQGAEAQGAAFETVNEYMEKLIDHRITVSSSDLFGRLAAGPLKDGTITREELVALAIILLMAGHDTNAKMIILGVGTLLDHPAVVARILTDEVAAHAAVEELLRLHSIADDDGFRVATADIDVGGITIPAGEGIVPLVRHANHDPAVYPYPNRLDVDRAENRHLSFGYGPHLCLGRELARAVQATAYRSLFRQIPSLRKSLADSADLRVSGWKF